MGSLYEIVYSAQQNNSGKRAVGYTVGAYAGVLSALQKADMIIVQGQGDSLYSGEYIPTNNDVVVNDFFQNGDKQAQVTFKTYMTFVANVKQDDVSESAEVVSIEQNISDHDGLAIMGGSNIQYPPSRFTKEALESCKLGCQSYGGFVIGAGVSFDQFVINFFKQFYGTMNWEEGKIEKIAAQGGLYVELMFPGAAGGNTARVIHLKVTVKVTKAITPNGYDVYFPSALMLLNNYKGLGEIEVTVTDSNSGTKDYKVDGTNVSFPYSGGSYNKKTGVINGYKPESVEQAVVSDQTIIATYKGSTLTGKTGRARFYFSKDFEQQVITEFGEIPAEYKDDLFRGVLSGDGNFEIQKDIVEASGFVGGAATGDLNTDSPYWAPGQVNWEKFKQNYRRINGTNFPEGHDVLIEQACQRHNLNTRMTVTQMYTEHRFKAKSFVELKNPGGLSVPGNKYKPGHRYKYPQLGGVEAMVATSLRGEGYGRYWVFDSYADAYHAKTYWVKVSTKYGTDKFKPQTVDEHYKNIAKGGYAEAGGYYKTLSSVYKGSLFRY